MIMLLTRDWRMIDLFTFLSRELYVCMHINVIYIESYVVHYAFSNISACTIQIGIRHFYFINYLTTQIYNNITVRKPHCIYIYIFYTLFLTHHIHLLTLRDRWTLVSWGGSPIRDPAPYQTWT